MFNKVFLFYSFSLKKNLFLIPFRILNAPSDKGCGRRLRQKEFDLIFTDYIGAWLLGQHLGPTFSHYRSAKGNSLDNNYVL